MYKTIRHGENSLQYTILPQNDDFRIEGKLSNANRLAGSTSSSASASASVSSSSSASCSSNAHIAHKRSSGVPRKRRTFFAYLGLIFVCTVIIGAVLIPFLVSAECLPSPTEWFLKTKAAFTHSGDRQEQQLQLQHITIKPTATAPAAPPVAAMLGQNVGKTVQIVNRNGIEQFILKVNKTMPINSSSSTTTTTTTAATTSTTSTTTTTTAATTIGIQVIEQTAPAAAVIPATPPTTSTILSTLATVATAPPLGNARLPATITTRIIQVPLLKSAAKKPIMPPVLAKTQSNSQQQQQLQQQQSTSNTDGAQNKSNNNAWMNTHWAYIDPSTYVQWSGYKAEDSVLLPALLGFALIGMILIITVCLVARNKRTIVSSVRKRNRNDIEEQGAEDNATLLTTTNLSDDD